MTQGQWFILLAGAILGGGLVAWVADSLESRHWFFLGACAAVAVFTLGYLLINGGIG